MKKYLLILGVGAILSTRIVSESWAECESEDLTCGENCCAKIIVDGNKKHAEIYKDYSASDEETISILSNYLNGQNLTSITMPDSVTYIEYEALSSQKFTSIEIPPYAVIDSGALPSTIKEIIIPDNLSKQTINSWYEPFYHFKEDNSLIFRCKGNIESCRIALTKYISNDGEDCEAREIDSEGTACFNLENFQPATKEQCTGNYGWTGKSCARKDENGNVACASGYADYKNKCWAELPFSKKRWTSAEAAQWLKDDDNEITITFKK